MATITVDQSYKIEQTSHDTLIAATRDGDSALVRIDRRLKRRFLQEFGKRFGGRRLYIWLFAWGASEAISQLFQHGDSVVLDLEYEGSHKTVEDLVTAYLAKRNLAIIRASVTSFRIGRHALADAITRRPWLAKHIIEFNPRHFNEIAAALGFR